MAVPTERTLDLPVPADVAFDAACRAVSAMGWILTDADRAMGIVSATAAPSAEVVALYLQPTTAAGSTVIIRPAGRPSPRALDQLVAAITQQAAVPLDALPPPPPPG